MINCVADVKLSIAPGALHLQRVPRELFDLIPGQAREVDGRNGTFWVKEMSLACIPEKHMLLLVYCDEALLREHQPDETGMDAPAG